MKGETVRSLFGEALLHRFSLKEGRGRRSHGSAGQSPCLLLHDEGGGGEHCLCSASSLVAAGRKEKWEGGD